MSPSGPVAVIPLTADPEKDDPEEGMALALSGGGYRAMVFHIGALWRLNEAGWLPKLKRISSVSGGSITAALLGLKWPKLGFSPIGVAANFESEVVAPLRKLASKTIDVRAILTGLLWFGTVADKVANAYRENLFGKATLQDLPDVPRFVINATNVQTGALWRFSKPYMGDWQVGLSPNPGVELAVAVGASSAFPPVLAPVVMNLDGAVSLLRLRLALATDHGTFGGRFFRTLDGSPPQEVGGRERRMQPSRTFRTSGMPLQDLRPDPPASGGRVPLAVLARRARG